MIVLVVGAGAVGSFLGGTLAATGHEVVLLRRRGGPGVERRGLGIVQHDGRRIEVAVTLADAESAPRPDLLVFAVKAFSLPQAAEDSLRWPTAAALTVQNGIGAEEEVAARRGDGPVVAGALTAAVAREIDGQTHRLSRGGLGLAPFRGRAEPIIEQLVTAFTAAGLPTRRYADPVAMKWSKLLGNLLGNATSALLDLDPEEVYADARLFAVERAQLREALAVMCALRVRPVWLPGAAIPLLPRTLALPGPLARAILGRVVRTARGGKMPSLRVHLRAGGGPSEVAWLNGAVARAGARYGVLTPVNERLTWLVSEASAAKDRAAYFRRRPGRLLEALARPLPG